MLKHNTYYEFFASMTVPNPDQVGYWIDLGANSKGKVIKVYNSNIKQWVKLTDVTSEDAVSPYIGSNGNWYVDNRDTGIPASGKNPYIGDNNNWFVYDSVKRNYIDTGILAKGLSAYEIAVKNGFVGTESDWLQFLRQPALDAAEEAMYAVDLVNKALIRVDKAVEDAEEAVENAQKAVDKADEISRNPMKIVDGYWYAYNFDTKEYYNTNLRANGKSFKIAKVYSSVSEMVNDYHTTDVEVGEFVWINTGNVEDPDDSKLYLKTDTEWQLVGDLSGNQGIQGESAYEVAVNNGFIGTEEEWIVYLRQPSLDAANQALQAKAQVEATETIVKKAEEARANAESIRVTNENARVSAESTRNSNEETRKTNETARVNAENIRTSQETTRQQKEEERKTAEEDRSNTFNQLVNEFNSVTSSAEEVISNANTAAINANTQANRAKQYSDNPPIVGSDGYWQVWSEENNSYIKTSWISSGIIIIDTFNTYEELISSVTNPNISDTYSVGSYLYLWNGTEWLNLGQLQGPKGDKGDKGEKGEAGNSGVYVGSGDMPDDCNVQIDPTGDVISYEGILETMYLAKENETNIDNLINNFDKLGNTTALSLDIQELPKICGCDLIYISNTTPSRSPDFIGQIYIDTSASKVYVATNVNNSAGYKVLN